MNIVAIIQARMGSTRLPGKVLMLLAGTPVLKHVFDRVQKASLLSKVIVATTKNSIDDKIVNFCKQLNIDCFRGEEDDVLGRYYFVAQLYQADIVVRITADCPLLDGTLLNTMLGMFIAAKTPIDYLSNAIKRTYPIGLDAEIFTFSALEQTFFDAKKDYQREHVTPYIYENPTLFKLQGYESKINYSYYRWTLDTIEDYQFIRLIYDRLYKYNPFFSTEDIYALLKKEPELLKINSHIKQKILKEKK